MADEPTITRPLLATEITATLGGFDLSPFMSAMTIDLGEAQDRLSVAIQTSVDSRTWETIAQMPSASFSIEGNWIGQLIGPPHERAHVDAWHEYISRAANPDDAPAHEIVRRTLRIERAYARMARAKQGKAMAKKKVAPGLTHEMALAEARRAVVAAFPDRADEIMRALERAIRPVEFAFSSGEPFRIAGDPHNYVTREVRRRAIAVVGDQLQREVTIEGVSVGPPR